MVIGAEVEHVQAFSRAFSFVDHIAPASGKAVTVGAAEAIIETVFSHVIAVALAAAEPVRKIISRAAAGNLPAVPVRFSAGHYF